LKRLRRQVPDARGARVVFLSHCLLNHNVRYLGGAEREAGAQDLVDGYLAGGVGICQMSCPEQRAWGGVLKRRMLVAYGAGGSWRGPLVRALLGGLVAYTRLVYTRLAREVAAEVADYRDCGVDVVGLVGIAGSPSCGVETTLDLPAAVDVLSRCPLARLDRRVVREEAVGAHTQPGRGLFVTALQQQFTQRGLSVRFVEYDFVASTGSGSAAVAPAPRREA
jgi:predicted secreted protein